MLDLVTTELNRVPKGYQVVMVYGTVLGWNSPSNLTPEEVIALLD